MPTSRACAGCDVSSGAWADPVQGTDLLFDDTFGLNLDPTWYESWKIVAKRPGLGVDHSILPPMDEKASGHAKYPFIKLDEAPYWNFQPDNYEIKDVYELEGRPKNNHLVSRGTCSWVPRWARPSSIGKTSTTARVSTGAPTELGYKDFKWEDGRPGPTVTDVLLVDVQRLHATAFGSSTASISILPDARPPITRRKHCRVC